MSERVGPEQTKENEKIMAKNLAEEIVKQTKNIESLKWVKLKQNSYSIVVISIVILFASGTILFSLNLLDEKIVSLENNQKDIVTKIDNIQGRLLDKMHAMQISYVENSFKIDQILTWMENNDKK